MNNKANFVENEPSTSSCCLKSLRKHNLENADLYPTSPADEYALCDDLAKPSDGPGSTEDELPEPGQNNLEGQVVNEI